MIGATSEGGGRGGGVGGLRSGGFVRSVWAMVGGVGIVLLGSSCDLAFILGGPNCQDVTL